MLPVPDASLPAVGTSDGANVEIRQRVGAENFYLFGLQADEVHAAKLAGYRPRELAERDPELSATLELLGSGHFCPGEPERHAPLLRSLLDHDDYLVLADYRSYVQAQQRASDDYCDSDAWSRRTIASVARMGYFSSDRSIRDYCRDIWHVPPVTIT